MKILQCKAHPSSLLIVWLHIIAMPLIFATLNSPLEFAEKALSLQKQSRLQRVNPLDPIVPLSGLVLKENASIVKPVRNVDAKCEVQMCTSTFCN